MHRAECLAARTEELHGTGYGQVSVLVTNIGADQATLDIFVAAAAEVITV